MESGALITAQGGPITLADLAGFMEESLGRQPTEDEHQELWRRYLTVGGASPVPQASMELAIALEEELSKGERRHPVRAGMFHGNPSMTAAVASLLGADVSTAAVLDLSPFSADSGGIPELAASALAEAGIESVMVPSLYETSSYIEAMAALCEEATFQLEDGQSPAFVLTFEDESGGEGSTVERMTAIARRVAATAKLGEGEGDDAWLAGIEAPGSGGTQPWVLAVFGSGSHSGLPTLGAVVEAISASPMDSVVFCPLGRFLEDLGTMYDIDVLAAERAVDLGLDFARAPVPTAMPTMVPDMAAIVREALGEEPVPKE